MMRLGWLKRDTGEDILELYLPANTKPIGSTDEDIHYLTGEQVKQHIRLTAGGSERKAKVIVMAESTPVYDRQPNKKAKKVGHIKMLVIPDNKKETLTKMAVDNIHPKAHITMDASHAHSGIETTYSSHVEKLLTQDEIDKVLPWVHTTIANAKMLIADTYHGITVECMPLVHKMKIG